MRNLSDNIFWTGIFMILSTNVYLITECLQLSTWISPKSHYSTTIYSYAYNLLYVWLLQFTILKSSHLISPIFPNVLLYSISYLLGGIGFALLGEVPFLRNIAITSGFWGRLNGNAKLTIIVGCIGLLILGVQQLKTAIKNRDVCRHLLSYLLFLVFYGTTLTILILSTTKMINIHVHHAICALLISFWFTDWSAKSSMITHAVLMGVVVEGIDFYGIGELSLFLLNTSTRVSITSAICIAGFIFVPSVIVLCLVNRHLIMKFAKIDERKTTSNLLAYERSYNYHTEDEPVNYSSIE